MIETMGEENQESSSSSTTRPHTPPLEMDGRGETVEEEEQFKKL